MDLVEQLETAEWLVNDQWVLLTSRAAEEIKRLRTATKEMARSLNLAREREAEYRAARISYASLFPPNADGEPDVGSIHENIRKLIAERDALKEKLAVIGVLNAVDALRGDEK